MSAVFLQAESIPEPAAIDPTRGILRTIRHLEEIERESIVAALDAAGGHVARTAPPSGLGRSRRPSARA